MTPTTFIAVDWSGALTPAGKIYLAEADGRRLHRLVSMRTRDDAVRCVLDCARNRDRVIVGLDFSFSFPEWFCRRLGATHGVEVWRHAAEHGESWLAACEWPFWGRPGKRRPELPAYLRRTEAVIGRLASIAPKSTFQVGGAGAVGTGSIRGMPHLLTLRDAGCSIWPFDRPGRTTIVEMYPRLLTGPVVKSRIEARRACLQQRSWDMTAADRERAESSEDAFDAAVSALVMSEQWSPLVDAAPDTVARIEGEIWAP